jgi:ubiquitin carboxyl-terminal hydrolase 2/21
MDNIYKEKTGGGLINLGATCYINTAIQCLSHCTEFLQLILENTNSDNTSLINEFKSILIEILLNNNSLKPYRFINVLKTYIKDIEIHEQNDINEFISLFLDKLNKDISYKNTITKNELMIKNKYTESPYDIQKYKMDVSWIEKTGSEYSNLIQLFYGHSITQIICGHCKHISHNYEIYSSIMLPLCDTLEESIEQYFQDEFLNDNDTEWKCDECNKKKRSKKTTKLWKLPNILIITLKRFTDTLQKNTKNVQIQMNIDLKNYTLSKSNTKYKLTSVACHSGSFLGGHYVAICKHPSNKWYGIDDLNITELNNYDISDGYVYFYTLDKS